MTDETRKKLEAALSTVNHHGQMAVDADKREEVNDLVNKLSDLLLEGLEFGLLT